MEFFVSSKSIDGNTGTGSISIEGNFPIPKGFDDPLIELFRPIRAKYKESVLFTISVTRREESILCTMYPSNMQGYNQDEFFKMATKLLPIIIDEYEEILDKFFEEDSGIGKFIDNAKNKDSVKNSDDLKKFVEGLGMKMPSIQKELRQLEKKNREKK